jgi:hypothetical protein
VLTGSADSEEGGRKPEAAFAFPLLLLLLLAAFLKHSADVGVEGVWGQLGDLLRTGDKKTINSSKLNIRTTIRRSQCAF